MIKSNRPFLNRLPVIVAALLSVLPAAAQPGPAETGFPGSWSFENDWSGGMLRWELVLPLPDGGRILPSTRMEMEREIDRYFPALFLESLLPLVLDSRTSILDRMAEDPDLRGELVNLADRASKNYSHYTADFSAWRCAFSMPVYPDLVELFIRHDQAFLPDRRISAEPTAAYTGILIYVEDRLPVHGLFSDARLERALFPRVLDRELDTVIDSSMVRPAVLASSGMVAYLPPDRMSEAAGRVGATPLRISARALFGTHHTDMVIPDEAARQILSSESNINLIREGRIAVIAAEH